MDFQLTAHDDLFVIHPVSSKAQRWAITYGGFEALGLHQTRSNVEMILCAGFSVGNRGVLI